MLNLVQSQKQTLKISPSQIQLLNFLQLNSLELEQYIKNELEENPILEEGKEEKEDDFEREEQANLRNDVEDRTQDYMDWDEFRDDDVPDYRTRINNYDGDESIYAPVVAENATWRDELKEQFHLLPLTERQKTLADFVVDSLTDEGYLTCTLDSLADDVSFTSGIYVEESELKTIVDILHQMDPPGLGAANLSQCLLMQLERHKEPIAKKAQKLIKNNFDELVARNYDKLMKVGGFSAEELKEIISFITTLNPHPIVGGSVNSSLATKDNIIPDYIVTLEGESMEVSLNNRGIPPLRINKSYANDVGGSRAANAYVNSKVNAANWLIDAIKQRETTMLKTMRTIVNLQKEYFFSGDARQLKPMVLRDVAERIGMDVSTISRVTSGKYAQTPFGVVHLKDLFTEGIVTDTGEEVSNRQIQLVLAEIIANEDKKNPLNDFQLTELLSKKGYNLARRTVAKYREILEIPSAPLRRIL